VRGVTAPGRVPARTTKAQRQHLIAQLLGRHAVTSQPQLVELLAAEGIEATQATVSRDLEDLGAVKVRVPAGESVYAIPEYEPDRIAPEDQLRRVMAEWVADVAHSGPLVVLRTPPGGANLLASAIDRAGLPDVAGSIAGDDTVLLITRQPATPAAGALASRLLRLAEGR